MFPFNSKTKIFFIGAGIICIVLFALARFSSLSNPFERGMLFAAQPFLKSAYFVKKKIASFHVFLKTVSTLSEENRQLQEVLAAARARILLYEAVQQENTELKALLHRVENIPGILGMVLSNPNQSPYDVLFIDVGVREGVRPRMLVVSEDVVLGVIEGVYQRMAKVQLFSSSGRETEVLLGKDRIPVSAIGYGGGEFRIEVPVGIPVNSGDPVIYGAFKQYLLGIVEYVESKPKSATQEIFFRAPINIFTAREVFVLFDILPSLSE